MSTEDQLNCFRLYVRGFINGIQNQPMTYGSIDDQHALWSIAYGLRCGQRTASNPHHESSGVEGFASFCLSLKEEMGEADHD